MSIVFHNFVYWYCILKIFASIFSTPVGTNYLDHSIGVRHIPFVSFFILEDFDSKLFKPFLGREFMCTGTSYDNNVLSYIYRVPVASRK
jgi:hypothetical protein